MERKWQARLAIGTGGCLMVFLGLVLWSSNSAATGLDIETRLIVTDDAAAHGSCDAGLICVEECEIWSNGATVPTGKFCCVDEDRAGERGTCSMSSRIGPP